MGNMDGENRLGQRGCGRFRLLQAEAVDAVTERLYPTHGSIYEQYGAARAQACREDLAFHLEFLQPVLEFGLLQPMVDYLCWLGSVLAARAIPADTCSAVARPACGILRRAHGRRGRRVW